LFFGARRSRRFNIRKSASVKIIGGVLIYGGSAGFSPLQRLAQRGGMNAALPNQDRTLAKIISHLRPIAR